MSSRAPGEPPTKAERRAAARAERLEREASERASTARRRRLLILGGVVAAAAVLVGVLIAVSRPADKPKPSAAAASSMFAGIPQQGITLGRPDAPATLVEYADLQCPFCAEYANQVLPTVVDRYVRTGKLKIQLHTLSFLGDDSVKAARYAAGAAAQNHFWDFTERLYNEQGAENSGWVTDDVIDGALAGTDVEKARAYADSPKGQAAVARATREGNVAGVQATPSFFVRKGEGVAKPLPVKQLTPDAFTAKLDAALS